MAEAGTPKNGKLESNETLKITWAASSRYGIASQTMTVDGKAIAPINGPYGGLYYSCPIGTWSAGSHTYTITATDSKGVSSISTGTFTVAAAGAADHRQRGGGRGRHAEERHTRIERIAQDHVGRLEPPTASPRKP